MENLVSQVLKYPIAPSIGNSNETFLNKKLVKTYALAFWMYKPCKGNIH